MRIGLISLGMLAFATAAWGQTPTRPDVDASPPQALSVTVYRSPYRNSGSISLQNLNGFALVTETRMVHLPAGESRLRFEGVVDGIQPSSAIITGLPNGVIEKNRDAALLSPESLIRASVGSDLTLVRTNRKTGKIKRDRVTIRSANDDGVVFQTVDGVEALRCLGEPESLRFDRVPNGLSSTPTLSALTYTPRPVTARVTLSYLAEGFDWAADYVARLNPDGKTLSLGAWITLANNNSVSLPGASTQIVAGRLNRVGRGDSTAYDSPRVIARCWPQGSTSDQPKDRVLEPLSNSDTEVGEIIVTAEKRSVSVQKVPLAASAVAMPAPPPPPPEQLGDLKLYRVPQTTTIAANQSKQVRLLEQGDVPFSRFATADLAAAGTMDFPPAAVLIRTKNNLADKLGLPLPAGNVAVFDGASGLLQGQAPLRDTAVDEDVELRMGSAPDVQVRQTRLQYIAKTPAFADLTPELRLVYLRGEAVEEVEISNARDVDTPFELRLQTYGAQKVSHADHPMALKDSRPIFRLILPANGTVKVRYAVSG